jgi:hypothetical protein
MRVWYGDELALGKVLGGTTLSFGKVCLKSVYIAALSKAHLSKISSS